MFLNEVTFRLREECLEKALIEQKVKLRSEAALSREKAIAESLRIARERFDLSDFLMIL